MRPQIAGIDKQNDHAVKHFLLLGLDICCFRCIQCKFVFSLRVVAASYWFAAGEVRQTAYSLGTNDTSSHSCVSPRKRSDPRLQVTALYAYELQQPPN